MRFIKGKSPRKCCILKFFAPQARRFLGFSMIVLLFSNFESGGAFDPPPIFKTDLVRRGGSNTFISPDAKIASFGMVRSRFFYPLRRGEKIFSTLHGFGAEVLKKNRPLVIFEDFVCREKSSIWIDFSKGICQAKVLISIFFALRAHQQNNVIVVLKPNVFMVLPS